MNQTLSEQKAALVEAVRLIGGQTHLAKILTQATGKPVSQQWVWSVVNRDHRVPAEWCIAIEEAAAGQVTRHDLRPDLYPETPTGMSAPSHGEAA